MLRVLRSIGEIDAAAWDALLQPSDAPFLCHRYLAALEASGALGPESGWEVHHLCLFEDGRLAAAAPACLKREAGGEFLFDGAWVSSARRLGVRYFPKLVLGVPYSAVPGRRLLAGSDAGRARLVRETVEHTRAAGYASVHVHFADEAELPALEAAGFARRASVQYVWRSAGEASFEDFLGRFTARRRKQLKRERRAVEEHGFEIATRRGAQVDPELAYRLHAATLARYAHPAQAMPQAFFEALCRDFPDAVELAVATHGGNAVAGAFNLRVGPTLFGRYWGSLLQAPFLHFAVCLYHPLEEGIPRGLRAYHPGAGGEHKLARGFAPELVSSAHWFDDARLFAQVREHLTHERAALEAGLPLWRRETGFKAPA